MAEAESFRCKLVTWEEIVDWTAAVAEKMRKCDCRPTVIIGLTRGGWVPARMLCDHMMVKRLYAVKTEHWGMTASPDGKACLTQELNVDVGNERVLVIDDITDTGESLNLAIDHLKGFGAKELKSAALLHFHHSKFVPDYFAESLPDDPWIWFIFPWNVHEDMRALLPKILSSQRTSPEIKKAFKDQFFIDVPSALVEETIEDLLLAKKIKRNGDKFERIE